MGVYLSAALTLLVFLHGPLQIGHADDESVTPDEYMLKAVCMYNFIQFTSWPASKELEETKTIYIGVVGKSPFENALRELQDSLLRKGKKNIRIRNHGAYEEGMDLSTDHILFISSSERENMAKIVGSIGTAPVLTISDTDDFLQAGGMISLILVGNKVRWKINRAALDAAGLQVSSKVLQLAIQIENEPGHTGIDRSDPIRDIGRPGRLGIFASFPVLYLEKV